MTVVRALSSAAIVSLSLLLMDSGSPGSRVEAQSVSMSSPGRTVLSAKAPRKVSPAFPLRVSADRRHLVDRRGRPFLINGEAAWSLVTGLNQQDAELYLEDRRRRGFNAIILNLIEHHFNGPENQEGETPFRAAGDFSQPNERYFRHVDWLLGRARAKGIVVFATPAYLGYGGGDEGWYQDVVRAGVTTLKAYGRYLGRRYKKFDNIVWVMGGDYGSDETLPFTRAIVRGLKETDRPGRLFTVHNARGESGIEYHEDEPWLSLNTTYSDCDGAATSSLDDYRRERVMPFVFFEGKYENEGASAVCLRSQAYWSVLAGSIGHFLGTKPLWGFEPNWKSVLSSEGSRSMSHFARLFSSRPWQKLVPDLSGSLLTGGRGSDTSVAGGAVTSDRTTAIVYLPSARAVTVDVSKITGSSARAWWFDPQDGSTSSIGTFGTRARRSFSPPGPGDWVLVIDRASLRLGPPGKA
jgi:hypothetical protein